MEKNTQKNMLFETDQKLKIAHINFKFCIHEQKNIHK